MLHEDTDTGCVKRKDIPTGIKKVAAIKKTQLNIERESESNCVGPQKFF